MVTQITDRLRQQTLQEISSTAKQIQSGQLKKALEEGGLDVLRRSSRARQQNRNRTDRNIKFKPFGEDGLKGCMTDFALTGRCNSYPPAKKRLCHSLLHPNEDHGAKPCWNPEPSSIWTPVKPSKGDRAKPTVRSLEFADKETSSWSTPPESPIPRPVSANSALEDSRFFPLRLISEESDNRSCFSSSCLTKSYQAKQCSSLCTSLSRSHSQPSFSTIVNNNLKRRLSEVDIPRPALDFDKMKARSFANTSHRKRTVKSPKYSSKRHGSISPKTPNSSKNVQTSEGLNIPVDMDSSLMITPTASPTSTKDVKSLHDNKCELQEDENANIRLWSFSNQKCKLADLDIKLIEEDGTLPDIEIQNTTMLFS